MPQETEDVLNSFPRSSWRSSTRVWRHRRLGSKLHHRLQKYRFTLPSNIFLSSCACCHTSCSVWSKLSSSIQLGNIPEQKNTTNLFTREILETVLSPLFSRRPLRTAAIFPSNSVNLLTERGGGRRMGRFDTPPRWADLSLSPGCRATRPFCRCGGHFDFYCFK